MGCGGQCNKTLVELFDEFVEQNKQGNFDESLLKQISNLTPLVEDAKQFRRIEKRLWSSVVYCEVLTTIALLRRWLEIEPDSKRAEAALGTFLLLHGPDWDEEAHQLLKKANQQ